MTEMKWITTADAKAMLSATTSPYPKDVLQQALASAPTARDDEQLALLALRGGEVAGWMWFTYGWFSDNGTHVRVASAQNHFTYDKFRGLGIGTAIVVETLRLPMHCVFSGPSGAAMGIHTRLGVRFFDQWPIFRLPLNALGIARNWRGELYSRHMGRVKSLLHVRAGMNAALGAATATWHVIAGSEVASALERVASYRHRRFQLPWNLDAIDLAARDKDDSMCAFVLQNSTGRQHYCSIYVREESVRLPFSTRSAQFLDGHLNEIYPPIEDAETARSVIAVLARIARQRGLGCLSIYASTPALRTVLEQYDLRQQGHRMVAVIPPVLDPDNPQPVEISENWWCRALNEDQVEETAMSARLLG